MAKHVIFVIDISGSMSGRKLEQTKDALLSMLDEMKEKALASFSGKQPESLNLPDCQNNLTFKGIGDGIGGTQGLEVNNVEGEAISDDASEDVKQKESLDAKCDEQGSEELEQDAPQSIDCDNKEAQEQKTVTGILKKK